MSEQPILSGQEVETQPNANVVGICHDCARRWGLFTCEAYPGGIPWDILVGDTDHKKAQPGDHGLQFLPANIFPYDPSAVEKSLGTQVQVAGLAVQAEDSGRVLMLQRSDTLVWEFPGGHLEDGEMPFGGARREWQEEVGTALPDGRLLGSWTNGLYQGFVWLIPSETDLVMQDESVPNPDGDEFEQVAWWDPDLLPELPSLRAEVRQTDWSLFHLTTA